MGLELDAQPNNKHTHVVEWRLTWHCIWSHV